MTSFPGLEQSWWLLFIGAGVPLVVCLVVGLLASVFQTITQIQDSGLSYLPKLLGLTVVLIVGGGWFIGRLQLLLESMLLLAGQISQAG